MSVVCCLLSVKLTDDKYVDNELIKFLHESEYSKQLLRYSCVLYQSRLNE